MFWSALDLIDGVWGVLFLLYFRHRFFYVPFQPVLYMFRIDTSVHLPCESKSLYVI